MKAVTPSSNPTRQKSPPNVEGVLRPDDHIDHSAQTTTVVNPQLGVVGWLRWAWRQLTSMRTAILLLLALAIAAVPGSLFPQREADPNGVVAWQRNNPDGYRIADRFQLFDVYSSVWFSSIYLLLFISLIGCIIPRLKHHAQAMRSQPPRTPARLTRLDDTITTEGIAATPEAADALASQIVNEATRHLKRERFRVARYDSPSVYSVSAESGYVKETGNLLFHVAMLALLIAVGVGSVYAYTAQRVAIVGEPFVNSLLDYQSIQRGAFVTEQSLTPYKLTMDSFDIEFVHPDEPGAGQSGNFSANMTITRPDGGSWRQAIQLNKPLRVDGDNWYLLGNGYAPTVVVRNPSGDVVYRSAVPFLPQDANFTSQGVVKIADGLDAQIGMVGFFYPTAGELDSGAYTSVFGDLVIPLLTFNVYRGDLGINDGTPMSVYELDTTDMTQIAGGKSSIDAIELLPGERADLPEGLGTIEFENVSPSGVYEDSVKRFASLQVRHDPTTTWVLASTVVAVLGLIAALLFPRRRMWVKATVRECRVVLETAGLARGEDHGLPKAIRELADSVQTFAAEDVPNTAHQN